MYFLQRHREIECRFCIFYKGKYKLGTTWSRFDSDIDALIGAADCTTFKLHLIME